MGEKMRILFTGANGQLGYQIARVFAGNELLATDVGEKNWANGNIDYEKMDITKAEEVIKVVNDFKPEVIIHGAAYTAVDQAETDREVAFLVNETGTKNIVAAAKEISAKVAYVSTDYVFSGDKEAGYKEEDEVGPRSVYGESKLSGEKAVLGYGNAIVARTAWLYGETGQVFAKATTGKLNFVETMLKLADSKQELKVVNDQIGSPTYAKDLAQALRFLIEKDVKGIFHVVNAGKCSWYDFACKIFELSKKEVQVSPVSSAEFPRPAKRPAYSVLHTAKLAGLGFEMRSWKEALEEYLKNR